MGSNTIPSSTSYLISQVSQVFLKYEDIYLFLMDQFILYFLNKIYVKKKT